MENDLGNYIRNEADETLVRDAFLRASEHFTPLAVLAQLWRALDQAKTQKERVEVTRNLMLIRNGVKSSEIDGYIVLTAGFSMWVEKNLLQLSHDDLLEITDAALESAERIREKII